MAVRTVLCRLPRLDQQPPLRWCKKNKKRDGSNYDIYTDGLKVYTHHRFAYAGVC